MHGAFNTLSHVTGEVRNRGRVKMNPVYQLVLIFLGAEVATQSVDTTHGRLEGSREVVLGQAVDSYLGVPFAKPPVGDLRFKHPVPAEPWEPETLEARTRKPACQQKVGVWANSLPIRQDSHEISEDCLYLNIWVPANRTSGSQLATLLWIYGGSFMRGSINTPLYDGKFIAAESNVILASVSYRVGAHGFLYLGNDTLPGNQGLMDQLMGMQWIYNNIENFGGDKNKITLLGESAGAASVGHHLLSPLSRGFFTRAILCSGVPNALWASQSSSASRLVTKRFAQAANCSKSSDDTSIFNCIRQLSPEKIVNIQHVVDTSTTFTPVIDGYFLPENPTMMKEAVDVDILLGATKDEGTIFLANSLPETFPISDSINVTKSQFTSAVAIFSYLIGDPLPLSKAILAEYVSTQVESLREPYEDIADDMFGDLFFKCPLVQLANTVSGLQNVYMYSYEYLIEAVPLPEWMGVPHSYELEVLFGHPLSGNFSVTEEEKEFTRTVMTYWANFAKTGNPNAPVEGTVEWPNYDTTEEKYLVLDVGDNLVEKMGLRKQHCAFWNEIVPLVRANAHKPNPNTQQPATTPSSNTDTNNSRRNTSLHWLLLVIGLTLLKMP